MTQAVLSINLELFIEMSSGEVKPRSRKFGLGNAAKYKSPDELVERLQILVGSKEGGKVSKALDNEIVTILDKLRQVKALTKKQYNAIYRRWVG